MVKIFTVAVFILLYSGCSTKDTLSQKEYERSNSASQKALNQLDRE